MEQGNDKLELVYGVEDKPSLMESAYAGLGSSTCSQLLWASLPPR